MNARSIAVGCIAVASPVLVPGIHAGQPQLQYRQHGLQAEAIFTSTAGCIETTFVINSDIQQLGTQPVLLISVDLTWAAVEKHQVDGGTFHFRDPDFFLTGAFRQDFRFASAAGVVTDGSRNFTPTASASGALVRFGNEQTLLGS